MQMKSVSPVGLSGKRSAKLPRILLILTEFPPRIGGMQTHALALAGFLHERGYPIEVITYRSNRHEEKYAVREFDSRLKFPVRRVLSRLGFWRNIETITACSAIFRADVIYSSTVFYGFLRDRLGVPVLCRSVGNDVMRPWIAYPFRFAGWLITISFLEQPLYDLFKKFNYPEWIEVLFRDKRRELMIKSASRMDMILANSHFTASLLSEIGIPSSRIKTVIGGVNSRMFYCSSPEKIRRKLRTTLQLPPRCWLISTACRLVSKKGVDFLLNTFRELLAEMPDAHLLIIGDGRHSKKYRHLAGRLGLEKHVTFAGKVPHDEIQQYFWASNLFVLASRIQINPVTGIRDAETMGRVLCEANASGVPVVAARSGGIPSVIQNKRNGLLFKPNDGTDLKRQILRVRHNPDLKKNMIRTGLKWARERFDWSVVLSAHERCINQTLLDYREKESRRTRRKDQKRVLAHS